MYKIKKQLNILLVILLIASAPGAAAASETGASPAVDVSAQLEATGQYLLDAVADPAISSIGGEWAIIGLSRSKVHVPQSYFDKYHSNVARELAEKQGSLTKVKYTEYSRVILALAAIGSDPSDVAGYDLLEKLSDFGSLTKQGINGPVYALIALDSKAYQIPHASGPAIQTTRQMLVDYILSKEITDANGIRGGFSLTGGTPDPDITGMALQALAAYRDMPDVQAAIDRALAVLDAMELPDGSFATYGVKTSESIVQVIVAKTALGIDPGRQVGALMEYYTEGGGFEHELGQGANLMASEQGLYALAAYDRYLNGMKALYDMTDVSDEIKVVVNGNYLDFDQQPVNEQGRVLVPMRLIFESLGADVDWEPLKQTVYGTLGSTTVEISIGSSTALVNDTVHTLDVPAKIVNGRTLVPIRFVSESLDANVDWHQSTKTVVISK